MTVRVPATAKSATQLFARVADGHRVIEHLRHFGEILRHHAGTDDEQLEARPVSLPQNRRGFVECRVFVRFDRFDRACTALDVDGAADAAAMRQAFVDLFELREMRSRRQRLNDDVEMPAARQAELFGFLRAEPITEVLGGAARQCAGGQFFEQIVFDAAARQRAGDLPAGCCR